MVNRTYQVMDKFDPDKDYPVKIRKGIALCLSMMKKGETIRSSVCTKTSQETYKEGQCFGIYSGSFTEY